MLVSNTDFCIYRLSVHRAQNGPDGLGFGTYTRTHPAYLKERVEAQQSPAAGVVGNVKRARHIAREYHGWDLPDESELRHQAMAGDA
ncbi:hypothetical protein BVU17_17735 (plasmid) [Haloarcula taiwanensis]|uniref:Uncharacterized protein n=1 Tax=Haloarcula taiwanensis TaxID=1932004 RepID=A0A2H5A491_9EURY|nr:hypothetical protein BVU17_17735 [Haloarcula taiwanensis]